MVGARIFNTRNEAPLPLEGDTEGGQRKTNSFKQQTKSKKTPFTRRQMAFKLYLDKITIFVSPNPLNNQ